MYWILEESVSSFICTISSENVILANVVTCSVTIGPGSILMLNAQNNQM